MSGLLSKNVLVIGDENSQIHNLEDAFKTHGMLIHTATCDMVTPEMINEKAIDLVLLNHLHEGATCVELLKKLNTAHLDKALPIFALVSEDEQKIQEVLAMGAADYVTPTETTDSVMQKVRVIFDDSDTFAGSSDIDITVEEASVTTTGIKVFVVEDDPLLRNLLAVRFDKSAFPFEFSSDGQKAIPAMLQFKPDVILLDLMLPGKSGFEVLSEIKATPALSAVPVLIFSNRDSQEDRKQAKDLGAVGFHVKAMTDLSELVEKIELITK